MLAQSQQHATSWALTPVQPSVLPASQRFKTQACVVCGRSATTQCSVQGSRLQLPQGPCPDRLKVQGTMTQLPVAEDAQTQVPPGKGRHALVNLDPHRAA